MSLPEPPQDQGGPDDGNRLRLESSPYLLQHAYNPVDWWPWSAEAIEEARRRDVPIFLSIGYSTCYWCHVMERESFEDPAIAAILNRGFLPIKVDREQRPDVDDIYMTACQVFTRMTEGRASGGWPLNAFLDPETLAPFVVGTYYPPEAMPGRPSFTELLATISGAWKDQREQVQAQGARIAEVVRGELASPSGRRDLTASMQDSIVTALLRYHDASEGGFGGQPKFPQPVFLEVLMEGGEDLPEAVAAVRRTLDRMAVGGIHDQVAGGFHRYAVDGTWTVPHFEKMLYDNGQLASLYARSVQRTGDRYHARVLRDLVEYVLREMTEEDGSFHSAQDAEVDAREGGTHVWRPEEIDRALAEAGLEAEGGFAREVYGLTRGPNFTDPHHPDEPASNVLRLSDRPEVVAAGMEVDPEEFERRLAAIDEVLLAARDRRPQPSLDDKVLASWNGLMIRGLAEAGRALEEPQYVEAASRAADAVILRLGGAEDLRRNARGDVLGGQGYLDDHALLADGLLALHAITGEPRRLEQARALVAAAREHFRDRDTGIWYDTRADQADLLVRACNLNDGAVPSGAGTMMVVLAELAAITQEEGYLDDLEAFLAGSSVSIAENPVGPIRSVMALHRLAELAPERAARLASLSSASEVEEPTEDGVRAVLEPDPDREDGYLIRLRIPDGWHVNAHDPGAVKAAEGLVGITFRAVSGGSVEVDWPVGKPWNEGILVHEGDIAIPVTIRRDAPDSTVVTVFGWQACDERVCLMPRRVEFRIEPETAP